MVALEGTHIDVVGKSVPVTVNGLEFVYSLGLIEAVVEERTADVVHSKAEVTLEGTVIKIVGHTVTIVVLGECRCKAQYADENANDQQKLCPFDTFERHILSSY